MLKWKTSLLKIDSATIENTVKALGGAAAGAAVGALLGPLGAVAGGLLGGLVGWLFGPSLDDLKKKAIDAIEDISQDWKRQLRPSAQSHIESHREKSAKMLQNTLGGYVKKYQKQINHIIEKEKKQQQALLELAQAAEDDIECFKKIQYAVLKQLASNTANTNAEAEYRLLQTQE